MVTKYLPIVFIALNMAISFVSFACIVISIYSFIEYPLHHPLYIAEVLFFWALTLAVSFSQVLYLRSRLQNGDCGGKSKHGRKVVVANVFLALVICLYGLKKMALMASFTKTWWHQSVLEAAILPALLCLCVLANAGLVFHLLKKERKKKRLLSVLLMPWVW